jgi:hypothetical protein
MAKARPPQSPSPSPDEPSRNEVRNDELCTLCHEPIGAASSGRMRLASAPGERTGRAHAKCIHERAMMRRAMGQRHDD